MLLELKIKDFAIIDNLHIAFAPGLNIFTGETGAGKSIIINAVRLVLGDRATTDLVRAPKEEAVVEAVFDISGHEGIIKVLEDSGLPVDESLIIKRVVSKAGRNKIFINNNLAILVTLAELSGSLIDIYGQSEHQTLTRPEEHIELLDAFAELSGLRREMLLTFRRMSKLQSEMGDIILSEKNMEAKKDLLQYQSKEITDSNLIPGEEDGLKQEKKLLLSAEKLFEVTSEADNILYSGEDSVLEKIGRAIKRLTEVAACDDRIQEYLEILRTSEFQLEDAASFFRGYPSNINFDQDRLEDIDDRLDLIFRLKGKYGNTIEEIIQRKNHIEAELNEVESATVKISKIKKEASAAKDKAIEISKELSKGRAEAASILKKAIEVELATLGMGGSIFETRINNEVTLDGAQRFGEKGMDRVEFYLSPNAGEELKPLARIASGGELSRIMLAIKRVTRVGKVSSLVFDEVDAGIGGGVADIVGQKLVEVSKKYQVLCITHLSQIAAYSDRHFFVSKETNGGRTFTQIRKVEGEDIKEELSRMLAGDKVTNKTREHVDELLKRAYNYKAN